MKYILLSIILIISISCKTADQQEVTCGTVCEQAKSLVEKIMDDPGDIMDILEEEQCVDCTYLIKLFKKIPKTLDMLERRIENEKDKGKIQITGCFDISLNEINGLQRGLQVNAFAQYDPKELDNNEINTYCDSWSYLRFQFIIINNDHISLRSY